jgi:hypothetical protein
MEQTDGERLKSSESESGCRDEELSPISPNKSDAMSQGKALESQLKDSLRLIHALVGEKVDIQHSKEAVSATVLVRVVEIVYYL